MKTDSINALYWRMLIYFLKHQLNNIVKMFLSYY